MNNSPKSSASPSDCCKNYNDIINLSRPESQHPKLSLAARAAQFAPFAALTGYEELVRDAADRTIIDVENETTLEEDWS